MGAGRFGEGLAHGWQTAPHGVVTNPVSGTHLHSGKVRDLDAHPPGGLLLMVASDRISAFDFVLPHRRSRTRARILTALSLWWFERL